MPLWDRTPVEVSGQTPFLDVSSLIVTDGSPTLPPGGAPDHQQVVAEWMKKSKRISGPRF